MNFKKLVCAILLGGMLSAALTGCHTGNDPSLPANSSGAASESDSETTPETDSVTPSDSLVFSSESLPKVITPVSASDELLAANELLTLSLESLYGKKVETGNSLEAYDKDRMEILVGDTSFPESEKALSETTYGNWSVSRDGNKIVIVSHDPEGLMEAVRSFTQFLSKGKKDGKTEIPSDYAETKLFFAMLNRLPMVDGKNPMMVKKSGYGVTCAGVMFDNCVKEDFNKYLNKLIGSEKYSLYASNEINKNLFATCVKDNEVLTVAFVPTLQRMVVLTEDAKIDALAGTEEGNSYTRGVCDTLITQIGLRYDYNPEIWNDYCNGLSHLIRLEDGSFVIIDGGFNRTSDGDRLYEIMKKQAPDPNNIVVAAWIFTHAHEDHVGVITAFTHASAITVERFIYNFPADTSFVQSTYAAIVSRLKTDYPQAAQITAHPGQVFYLRNAKITMLSTSDLYSQKQDSVTNESSLVFRVEVAGKSIMYLGDLGVKTNPWFCNMYENSLKSDIVQTAHHGYEGATYRTYSLIQADYVLWDTGYIDGRMEHLLDINGNSYFSRNDQIVKWVAGGNIDVITLKEGQPPEAQIYSSFEDYINH